MSEQLAWWCGLSPEQFYDTVRRKAEAREFHDTKSGTADTTNYRMVVRSAFGNYPSERMSSRAFDVADEDI